MTTVIYWFSGTGNSLAVAQDLARQVDGAELVPMPWALYHPPPIVPDRVGLVFPVYALGLPGLVREFVLGMPVTPGTYFFAVATMGGTAGSPHRQLRSLLCNRGVELSAGWTLTMPNNYIPMSGAPSPARQLRVFSKVDDRVPEIAAAVNGCRPGPGEDSWLPLAWLGKLMNPFCVSRFRRADRRFRVGEDCTRCGMCEKVCPVGNIHLVDGRPTWRHHCEQCMACLQWCPAEAIQFGRLTKGRRRYHHPRFAASDFFQVR